MTDATGSALADALRDRYRLERELGRGGMATVYLARDLKHDRLVALKVLRPELSPSLGADRFLREIKLTARLDHPHILPVFDSGAAEGLFWYTMPFVEGESLRELLRREGQLTVEHAVRLASEIADALDCAHRQGIVHRDVKPENVLVRDGHARVADFGVARALEAAGEDQLTATGLAVGTPAYMAPEQASAGPVDARADIYALGCVMYEMLAGEPPYTGRSAQAIIAKRFTDPVPSIRRLRPEIPEHVDAAIRQGLAKVPADRFATARGFAEALRGGHAVRSAAPTVARESASRLRKTWVLAGAAAVLLAAGVAVWRLTRPGPPPIERIAVYPFANRTADASLAGLGNLSADWIARAVARVPGIELVTIPPVMADSSLAAASAAPGRDQLGKAAGAHTMIWGSIYRTGDSLRLVANLTDVARGSLLATVEALAPARAPEPGIQALAERVTTSVLTSRSRDTTEMLMRSGRPPTFAAFQAFAEGWATAAMGEAALPYFERAVALDSTFLSPLVWIGFMHRNNGDYAKADSVGSIAERQRERLEPFEQAALDRMLAEVRGDNAAAFAASRRVLAAAPTSDWAKCVTAEAALWINQPRTALQTLEGVETRPGVYNGDQWCDLVPIQAWLMLDDGKRALATAQRYGRKWGAVYGEGFDPARLTVAAIALAHLGRMNEAGALADSAVAVYPAGFWDLPLLMTAHELRHAGDRVRARKLFEHIALKLYNERDTASIATVAEGLYWADRRDEASKIFRQLTEHPKFSVRARGALGVLSARREDRTEAEAADAWLAGVDPRHRRGEVSVWRARIAAALGERERATKLLAQAFAEGQTQDYWGMYGPGMAWFRQDPHFESLLDFPPYQALLRPRG